MGKTLGRPLKYRAFLDILDDDTIYSPALIVYGAMDAGVMKLGKNEQTNKKERIKIRHTMARFAKNHHFPPEGDGSVTIAGQAPAIGWTGARWKAAMPTLPTPKDDSEASTSGDAS